MNDVIKVCTLAKENASYIGGLSKEDKNGLLRLIASALKENAGTVIAANKNDLEANRDKPAHILDRLSLNIDRINSIARGLEELIVLSDPIGEVIDNYTAASGIHIKKVRVPLGVIGIIYEARPNVTVDAIGLCLKTGNAVVLRGSKDAINSNAEIVRVIKSALGGKGYNPEFIQLITDTKRESAETLMKARGLIDVLIPRGSSSLIKTVVENSTVPVIETGAGNCHAYVHSSADLDLAEKVVLNAKLSRPSVCNAVESLLIDKSIAKEFLPRITKAFASLGVEVVADEESRRICGGLKAASDDDFYTEFLDLKISVKIVDDLDEAIKHINKYGTQHSEVIIATDLSAAEKFFKLVDSAAVYLNASTRFTDGFEFGLGAEMGISTQKLHARGPLGLRELTSQKYIISGNGQTK